MSVRPPEVRVLKQQVATHNRKSGQLHQQTDLTFKVAIVGPPRAGKTRLANQMANTAFLSADIPNHSYSETAAVRIQSFAIDVLAAGGRSSGGGGGGGQLLPLGVECELWDVSGSAQYEQLWAGRVQRPPRRHRRLRTQEHHTPKRTQSMARLVHSRSKTTNRPTTRHSTRRHGAQ